MAKKPAIRKIGSDWAKIAGLGEEAGEPPYAARSP